MKTKSIILFIAVIWISISHADAQTIKRVKDPNIVAQNKRQVMTQWGDWRPKAKYFLGIQTNVHYTMVWGWLAPSRNRDYRNGADIRPLSLTGLQNQRYASTKAQENETEEVLEEVRNVYTDALAEQYHYSAVSVPTDPLYILYYKSMLSDMETFDPNSTNYINWGFSNPETFQRFSTLGMLRDIKKKIEIVQDKYRIAKSADMPRGKRILMFHECLIEWRDHQKYLAYMDLQGVGRIKAENRLEQLKRYKENGNNPRHRTDAEIFVDVFMGHGN